MKELWAKLKEWNRERQKIADANAKQFSESLDRMMEQMRLEQQQRQQAFLDELSALQHRRENQRESPMVASFLAFLFLPERFRENILGDISETYPAIRAKDGTVRAYVHIFRQIIFSAWPVIKESMRRQETDLLLRWIMAVGFVALVGFLVGILISNPGSLEGVDDFGLGSVPFDFIPPFIF